MVTTLNQTRPQCSSTTSRVRNLGEKKIKIAAMYRLSYFISVCVCVCVCTHVFTEQMSMCVYMKIVLIYFFFSINRGSKVVCWHVEQTNDRGKCTYYI